jgi:hypothetical protein
MAYQFSQKLIERLITSFKKENEVDISIETANEYLNSFADLYLAFARQRPGQPTL